VGHLVGAHGWVLPGFIVGVTSVFLFATPIYRRLHCRPLFLPRCPHCGSRPKSYDSGGGRWPGEIIRCGSCQGICEVCYDPSGIWEARPDNVPRLCARWPYFIGRYVRVT
jgi:hypothetical protein